MRAAAVPLVPVLLLGASATPAAPREPDRSEIASLAQRYLENRARKVTTGPRVPGFGVPVTAALAAELDVHERKLDAATASSRTRYRSAVVSTRVDRFDTDQNGKAVVAHVHERAELYFEDAGPVPSTGPVRSTGYALPHLLTFVRDGKSWVLAGIAVGHYKHCALLPETQRPSEC